jgi:hypothetical protein
MFNPQQIHLQTSWNEDHIWIFAHEHIFCKLATYLVMGLMPCVMHKLVECSFIYTSYRLFDYGWYSNFT